MTTPGNIPFVDTDAHTQGADNLRMVHMLGGLYDNEEAEDDEGNPIPGIPKYGADATSRFDTSNPAYQQGGYVQTLLIKNPSGRDHLESMIVCSWDSCRQCYPGATFPQSYGGLPFVHAKNLSMSGNELHFKQEVDEEAPELADRQAVDVTSCEQKVVVFQYPVDADGYRRRSNPSQLYRVLTAVCVPENCSVCRPAEGEYRMRGVTDSRRVGRNGFEYYVLWVGYGENGTWEPIENIAMNPEFILDFHEQWPDSPRPTAAQARQHNLDLPPRPRRARR